MIDNMAIIEFLQYVALLAGLTLLGSIPRGVNLLWRSAKSYRDFIEHGTAFEAVWRGIALLVCEICRSIELVCFFVFFLDVSMVGNKWWIIVFIACIATQSVVAIPQKIIQIRAWWRGESDD